MADTLIYLVRHGESEWNVARLTQGQTSHPRLTDLGRAQALAAAETLLSDVGDGAIGCVVSSDLVRAMETAEIIAKAMNCEVRADPRLREQSLGSLEGLDYEAAFTAGAALDWSDPEVEIGGGESVRQVAARMSEALSEFSFNGQVVVVVSHGDAIRIALATRDGEPFGTTEWLEVPNGSVHRLDRTEVRRLQARLPSPC